MTSTYTYPTDIEISYNTTREYRESLRRLFSMSRMKYPDILPDIDDESRDELEYDDDAAIVAMDFVAAKTQGHPIFKELYLMAAARMLSTNEETGLSILFSYDYLELFHYCFVSFCISPGDFDNTNRGVIELTKRLR